MNPLVQLQQYGQSFWLDNIRRQLIQDGTFQQMIRQDGLRGMTSNPSIFQKAIGQSDDYDAQLQELTAVWDDTNAVYEALAISDIQAACDLFAPVYVASQAADGYVSLEVSPLLAYDTEGTISEARRLFALVDRPNLMIKVPATAQGIPAIQQLLSEGINVNITLMFNMAHYEAVAHAYLHGISQLIAKGGDPRRVASVASFFISRIDTAVDNALEAIGTPFALELRGQTAIANAKVVYQRYLELFHGEAFAPLQEAHAAPQRLLWASTGTKNPNYPDTLYIDELIGPETVNTIPPATVDAFRQNGTVQQSLIQDVEDAHQILTDLATLGIDLDQITSQLQTEGVDAFIQSFTELWQAIEAKIARLRVNGA
jgi:transaldolase